MLMIGRNVGTFSFKYLPNQKLSTAKLNFPNSCFLSSAMMRLQSIMFGQAVIRPLPFLKSCSFVGQALSKLLSIPKSISL